MNTFYYNLQFPRYISAKQHLTSAVGPWIPQTPDSQQGQDPKEQWQKTNEDEDDSGEED
jgi:hypothetical protein